MRDCTCGEIYKNLELPKLIITKFEGTRIDWFRFWNRYESETDRSQARIQRGVQIVPSSF